MILTVPIVWQTKRGRVSYSDVTKAVNVFFPDERLGSQILKYLTTSRDFIIPLAQEVEDDYEIRHVLPTQDMDYFELAMSSIYGKLGAFVEWNKEEYKEE